MVNLTNDEFAVIKAILQVVSDKCNLYWQDESQAQDDYDKMRQQYLDLDTSNVYADVENMYANLENPYEDLTVDKIEYENYLELKKDLEKHIELKRYDVDLTKLLYELK